MDIKILENLLQVTIDRENLRNRHHQAEKPEGVAWDALQKVVPHREGTSSRQECAFCKVRRADSRWVGET